MDQVHIGYTIWQDPNQNSMPKVVRIDLPHAASMGVAVEGSYSDWPGASGDPVLPQIDAFNRQRRYIDIYNRGQESFAYTASAAERWILLSQGQGTIDKEKRIWVGIDWNKAPKGEPVGDVKITRVGGDSVTVKIPVFNPAADARDALDGFVQSAGYISIEAEHFSENVPAAQARWEKIDGYGRTLSAMSILPMTASSVIPPKDSPHLAYKMYLFDPQKVDVRITLAPTLNFVPDRGSRYGISFDDQAPQIVEAVPQGFDARNGNREWEESVRNACRITRSMHSLSGTGYHTLKIWMVDPGVVIEKIVVDLGGLKRSYLGPPESYFHETSKAATN
jgi:hypothetical protein